MTVLESYQESLTRLGKKKAASFYAEDFTIFLNNAVIDRCNDLYKNYEKTQLLSDDLQNLSRHVVIDIDDNVPFPFNIKYIDGTPFVKFYDTSYIEHNGTSFNNALYNNLNCDTAYQYRATSDNSLLTIARNSSFEVSGTFNATSILDVLVLEGIEDGIIISIKTPMKIRDYRYGSNTNYLPFGFDLGGYGSTVNITSTEPKYFYYNSSTKMFTFIYGSGYTQIDDIRILLHSPNDYWHATGMMNIIESKNSIECEKTFVSNVEVKRLTSQVRAAIKTNGWLKPSFKYRNNYFKEMNRLDSVYPDFEISYAEQKEKDLVLLKQVEVEYLKEPKRYVLTDEDVNSETDTTESLEFQDYICKEIVEQVVVMFLERHSNPRVQTFGVVNDANKVAREQK